MRFPALVWATLVANALFLVWVVAGGGPLAVVLWVAADVVLGALWLVSPHRTRDCPSCGRAVGHDAAVCTGCGYNLALASAHDTRAHHYPTNPGIKP
ncbi:zinc ribbon domain-containing protein [Saccharothrix sp. NRRL B-16314]|uniref:zinc ribbon domain-containing protein n=1 Tax=Saccharothrix sp. NRRL B-16314 TaxID=1463825 RepID=UPI000524A14D|nr:zinc ribbon domain-containing protein [Saccharothrix sp. NRRL B-16314]